MVFGLVGRNKSVYAIGLISVVCLNDIFAWVKSLG